MWPENKRDVMFFLRDILEENNQALSSFGNCLEIRVIDFESRLIMLENNLSRREYVLLYGCLS